jgi:hypothetical protein
VPGMDRVGAWSLAAEIGVAMEQFPTAAHLARSPSEKCDFVGSIEEKSSIMFHGEKLPAVPTGSGVSASTQPA